MPNRGQDNNFDILLSKHDCQRAVNVFKMLPGIDVAKAEEYIKNTDVLKNANFTVNILANEFTNLCEKKGIKTISKKETENYLNKIQFLNLIVEPQYKLTDNALDWLAKQSPEIIYHYYLNLELATTNNCFELSEDIPKKSHIENKVQRELEITADNVSLFDDNIQDFEGILNKKGMNLKDINLLIKQLYTYFNKRSEIFGFIDSKQASRLRSKLREMCIESFRYKNYMMDIDYHYEGKFSWEVKKSEEDEIVPKEKEILEIEPLFAGNTVLDTIDQDFEDTSKSISNDAIDYSNLKITDPNVFCHIVVGGQEVKELLYEYAFYEKNDIANFIKQFFNENYSINYENSIRMINISIIMENMLEIIKTYMMENIVDTIKNDKEIVKDQNISEEFNVLIDSKFINHDSIEVDFITKAAQAFSVEQLTLLRINYRIIPPDVLYKLLDGDSEEIIEYLSTIRDLKEELKKQKLFNLKYSEDTYEFYILTEKLCYDFILDSKCKDEIFKKRKLPGKYTEAVEIHVINKAIKRLQNFLKRFKDIQSQ